jgi:PST family polysaccharide transporter
MKDLVKGSGALTLVSVGEMIVRFVRTKFIAMILGPAGLGFIAQLTNFFETLRIFGDMGARQAVVRQIAETRLSGGRESEAYKDVISSSFVIALSAASLTALVVTLFSHPFSKILFGDDSHARFIVAMALLLPMASISTVVGAIIRGNLDFSAFAKYTLAAYLVLILVTPPLLYKFHLWGAVALQGLFFLFPLIAYLVLNGKSTFLRFSKKLHAHIIRYQFEDGALQVYLMLLNQLTRIGVGVWVINVLGLESMGVYQMALAFSTVYVAMPIQAMSSYVFPMIAAARNSEEINREINDSFRFPVFILMPILITMMVTPGIFIRIFFSAKFLVGIYALRILLFYSLTMIFYSPLVTALMAKRHLKVIYVITALSTLSLFLMMWPFFYYWKLAGIALAFSVSGILLAIVYYIFAKRHLEFYVSPKNIRLMILSGIWLLAASIVGFLNVGWPWQIGVLALVIPWFFMSAKGHERKFLVDQAVALWRKQYGNK